MNIIKAIKKEFQISKEVEKKLSYVGLHTEQNQERLEFSQAEYIQKLNGKVENEKGKQERPNEEQSMIKQLVWVAGQTHPD